MPRFSDTVLFATLLGISASLSAQAVRPWDESDILARLSYSASMGQTCVEVTIDGAYRIQRSFESVRGVRSTPSTELDLLNGPQRLEGKLSQKEFREFEALLDSRDFRSLGNNHAGLIRQNAEDFVAEIPIPSRRGEADDRTLRLQWLKADDESPFPATVEKLVSWIRNIQTNNSQSFTAGGFPDVCPRGGISLVQPSIADNQHP
jgi:hypothetical protein